MADNEIPRELIENAKERTERLDEAEQIVNEDVRKLVVNMASRIVDVLSGKHPLGHITLEDREGPLATAPPEIPLVAWYSRRHGAPGDEDYGNLGEFLAELFPNERPSVLINSAFYAGVLAMKEGLIEPEPFHHDSMFRQ